MEILTMGERMMIYRKRAGINKKELAQRAGVSVSTITNYENDATAPSHNIVTRIAYVLGITVNRLLFGFDDPKKDMGEEPLLIG